MDHQPYLYQIYLPCFAIVIVSMISFLIPLTAIPGRVTLIVTIFLTITHIFMKQLVRNKKNNFYTACPVFFSSGAETYYFKFYQGHDTPLKIVIIGFLPNVSEIGPEINWPIPVPRMKLEIIN